MLPENVQTVAVKHLEDDILKCFKDWSHATFIVLHWTSFSTQNIKDITKLLARCNEGAIVLTFTHKIKDEVNFDLITSDKCTVSWGESDYFIYEKISPKK